jgi:2-oxoglutarate ferredoxin oxidoreductase subunit delta
MTSEKFRYNEVSGGKIIFDRELCKGCHICVSFCPEHIIIVSDKLNDKGYRTVAFEDEKGDKCRGCGICSDVCPDFAIRMADSQKTNSKEHKYDRKDSSSVRTLSSS